MGEAMHPRQDQLPPKGHQSHHSSSEAPHPLHTLPVSRPGPSKLPLSSVQLSQLSLQPRNEKEAGLIMGRAQVSVL